MLIVRYTYLMLLCLACLVGFSRKNKLEKPFIALKNLVAITLVNEIIAEIAIRYLDNGHISILHFFTVIEYYLYIKIYQNLFTNSSTNRLLGNSVFILFILQIINSVFIQKITESNTNIFLIESLFLIIISLLFFNHLAKNITSKNILKIEAFWFNSFVFIFYIYNINLWGFHSLKVYNWVNPPLFIYNIMLILCIAMYLVFGLILLKNKKQNTS